MVNQFDVYWVDLNPTVGAEMQKKDAGTGGGNASGTSAEG